MQRLCWMDYARTHDVGGTCRHSGSHARRSNVGSRAPIPERGIGLVVLPPRSPTLSGRVERANGSACRDSMTVTEGCSRCGRRCGLRKTRTLTLGPTKPWATEPRQGRCHGRSSPPVAAVPNENSLFPRVHAYYVYQPEIHHQCTC